MQYKHEDMTYQHDEADKNYINYGFIQIIHDSLDIPTRLMLRMTCKDCCSSIGVIVSDWKNLSRAYFVERKKAEEEALQKAAKALREKREIRRQRVMNIRRFGYT